MKRTATLLNIILAATLCATALAAQEKIDTPQDFSVFVHGYYLSPRPGLVASAIEHYGSTYAANKSSLPPMIAFFNRIFSDNPGSRAEWKKVIDRQAPELRDQLLSALGTGAADFLAGKRYRPPSTTCTGAPTSPAARRNTWKSFCASRSTARRGRT